MIERMDADGNGTISQPEMEAARQARAEDRRRPGPEQMFERLDANEDGVIDAQEFAAAAERHATRGEHGGKHHGGRHGDGPRRD
jgi:Ca2+-binding EF-hand superfamily protein